MGKSLIIVESPAKMKTLKKFLGPSFVFQSSYGHVRDLPESEFGVDVEKGFVPTYIALEDKKEVIDNLKKAAAECDVVYLSPDPDREGEAIAWHISQILPPDTKCKRVTFNSITKDEVKRALANPKDIDMALVNAQQARRILDRLVGYSISPLLNKRMRRGRGKSVSAGRVQSVALKIVVDREREIEAFVPFEYWTITATFKPSASEKEFTAQLFSIDGKRLEKEPITEKIEGVDYVLVRNEKRAQDITSDLEKAAYTITRVERKEKKRNPEAPFITSTLQQEASRHYRFSPAKTMQIAQSLYEGVDIGQDGGEGLITYMRTDSVRIAPEALDSVRSYIKTTYGDKFLSEEVRQFHVKKSAQDAHEAIRPTTLTHSPESIEQYLTRDQFLLYSLIWKRFLACQMAPAIYDTVSVDITAGIYLLRATGSIIKFPGFLTLYEEKQDEEEKNDEKMLPPLEEQENVSLRSLTPEQSFTRPPPRFTEASLIKELEKSGIGRPSTYATIMNKIQSRDYTSKENGRLKPTDLGRLITEILENSFKDIVNIGFTAAMEDNLELVAENKKEWHAILEEFWNGFKPALQIAEHANIIPRIDTDIICPKCGGKLQKIWAKSKYFLGCENFPDCDYSASLEETTFNKADYAENFDWDQRCPICQSEMKLRFGKYGPFLGCTQYPKCRGIVNIPKKGEAVLTNAQEKTPCPAVGCVGHLIQRRSRFGKLFLSCSEFPNCDVIGNSIEIIKEKYINHPKTAYVKKAKGYKKAKGQKKSEGEAADQSEPDGTKAKTTKKIKAQIPVEGAVPSTDQSEPLPTRRPDMAKRKTSKKSRSMKRKPAAKRTVRRRRKSAKK